MPIPDDFANFDVAAASITVWLFKKSGGTGGSEPTFTGRWITLTADLEDALKQAVIDARAGIEEVHAYGLLAQNNESSVLSIDIIETYAHRIVARAANPLPQYQVTRLDQVKNTEFYVIRLAHNGQVLHAARKADKSWKSRQRNGVINVVFQEQALDLQPEPPFAISQFVDFFILQNQVFIAQKANFESVLSYRQAHADDFIQLQAEPSFAGAFTNLAPLVAYVGNNKIQLRRLSAIRQKRHFENAAFMAALRANAQQYNLTINFSANNQIEPTPETCADIIIALLDHRLWSGFSQLIYDVPDATQVN